MRMGEALVCLGLTGDYRDQLGEDSFGEMWFGDAPSVCFNFSLKQ